MILVTGCNVGYYHKMANYLETLKVHADFPWQLVTVGFDIAGGRRLNDRLGSPPETESIQHGSFLHVLDTSPDEVIIYTDGDFIMQRPMDDEERELLNLKDGEVVTGYNFGPDCTLLRDARILGPLCTEEQLVIDWGEIILTAQDYNAGFLAMTRRTWEALYWSYMASWDHVSWTFKHQARQQWLISYKIAKLGFSVKLCPWSLHAHGHGGLKPGMEWRFDGVYHNGKKALFRHYL